MKQTTLFLNTWKFYNEGGLGFGWMTPEEATEFLDKNEDDEKFISLYGEEFFIADIDNYTGFTFDSLEYSNIREVIETIEALEDMDEYERAEVIAVAEYLSTTDIQEAISKKDSLTIYSCEEDYYDMCDECLDFGSNDILERYFDYDAYHRDCMFDAYEASNGVIILG